jgi:hypothetical protein
MITLITPTGDRPEAFAMCEYWVSRQTPTEEIQWIVIDDGKAETCVTHGQEYVRRQPQKSDPKHTLLINIQKAIPLIKGNKVLIIEDDDYYSPNYIETMSKWLESADLVGERGAKYYYLEDRRYYFWSRHQHASFCRTGFTNKVIETLSNTLQGMDRGDCTLDLNLWENFTGSKFLQPASGSGQCLCLGIKQMPGRPGGTHTPPRDAQYDTDSMRIQEWLGDDYRFYRRFINSGIEDLLTYTCLFGDYDKLPEAHGEECYAIHNKGARVPSSWISIPVPYNGMTPRMCSRYWKMNSHEAFSDRTTLYLDAHTSLKAPLQRLAGHMDISSKSADVTVFKHNKSARIIDEVKHVVDAGFADKSQVDTLLTRKFKDLPVGVGGCILRRPTSGAESFNEMWWKTFSEGNYARDQVILPICLQESGATYCMLDEPTPFYGEVSQWMSLGEHLKPRSKV